MSATMTRIPYDSETSYKNHVSMIDNYVIRDDCASYLGEDGTRITYSTLHAIKTKTIIVRITHEDYYQTEHDITHRVLDNIIEAPESLHYDQTTGELSGFHDEWTITTEGESIVVTVRDEEYE
jgi:hypothetical protein